MIPIPDPGRLFPPRPPSSGGQRGRPASLAEGLLTLGGLGILLITTLGGGAMAFKVWHWLAIPGGLLGFGIGMAILEAPPLVLGSLEALFYFGVIFLFSGGLEGSNPTPSWFMAGSVAVVFIWAAISARRTR